MAITSQDIFLVFFLALLEGLLSVDNALVLALLSRRVPPEQRRKALTYGVAGAFLFRLVAILAISKIIQWNWIKFVGGGYLIWMAAHHVWKSRHGARSTKQFQAHTFWKVVVVIELTDIAFALDSILAAIALSQKFWVVFIGGCMGILMMRLASGAFGKLLERYPNFEKSAYLMIAMIGSKLILEGFHLEGIDFHSTTHPEFWIFWGLLGVCLLCGFKETKID